MTQNAVYTRNILRYKKDSVFFVFCLTGLGMVNDVTEATPPLKIWLFNHGIIIEVIVFFDIFFAMVYMKTDAFLSFFLTVIYICKELSISTSFSRFSVFLHISKSPAIIEYPCLTSILFIKIPIFTLRRTAAGLYHQLRIKWYLML